MASFDNYLFNELTITVYHGPSLMCPITCPGSRLLFCTVFPTTRYKKLAPSVNVPLNALMGLKVILLVS